MLIKKRCIECGLSRSHNAPDECDHCGGSLGCPLAVTEDGLVNAGRYCAHVVMNIDQERIRFEVIEGKATVVAHLQGGTEHERDQLVDTMREVMPAWVWLDVRLEEPC